MVKLIETSCIDETTDAARDPWARPLRGSLAAQADLPTTQGRSLGIDQFI